MSYEDISECPECSGIYFITILRVTPRPVDIVIECYLITIINFDMFGVTFDLFYFRHFLENPSLLFIYLLTLPIKIFYFRFSHTQILEE